MDMEARLHQANACHFSLAKEEKIEETVIIGFTYCLIIPDLFVVLENYFNTILSV